MAFLKTTQAIGEVSTMDREDLIRGGKQGIQGSSEPTLHPGVTVNHRPPSIEQREANALPNQARGGNANPIGGTLNGGGVEITTGNDQSSAPF